MICGTALLYTFGLVWLKFITEIPWDKAIAVGMLPFLPGDALKIAVAVPIARVLRPIVEEREHSGIHHAAPVTRRP